MTETTPTNYYELLYKFSELIFASEAEQYMTIISKYKPRTFFDICPSMDYFKQLTQDEQYDILDEIEENRSKGNTSKIEFMVNNEHYEVRVTDIKVYISKYLNEQPAIVFESMYNQKPSSNIDEMKGIINQLSETYDHSVFSQDDKMVPEPFFENIIASITQDIRSFYISDDFQVLVSNFKSLFSESEQLAIDHLKVSPFIESHKFNSAILKSFNQWAMFLKKGNYDNTKRFIFNDLDNKAYFKKKGHLSMIIQESQNTIFAYILNTESMQLKVWNCADINPVDADSQHYLLNQMKEADTYIEAMQLINEPYSYYVYPFELLGLSYPKSTNYFLENFNDNSEHLIYDSLKGFKVSSKFSYSLITDIDLLNTVLN